MTLYVHRAERSDTLVSALGELLADPLADPFAEEVIAVPARGIERWITQRLSHRLGRGTGEEDGICAGVRFPSPAALVAEVLGLERGDPWDPDRLVWTLLTEIDRAAGEDWCHTLNTHLGVGSDDPEYRRGRRFAVARRLAGLFSGYASQRPSLVAEWGSGADTDGFGSPLPPDLGWQAELWRRTAQRLGTPDIGRRAAALDGSSLDGLPERLSVFGPTRLPVAHLDVLRAVADSRDVHLWLPHPSPKLWNRLEGAAVSVPLRRRDDQSLVVVENPLLSSLGRDSRELQLLLSRYRVTETHHAAPVRPATLLGRLQGDICDDRRPDGSFELQPGDNSVQIHACHGPSRQVDVLREVLVGLLDADPTLEPRDILVMCPDIEVYAPLIAAAFGLADVVPDGHPAHRLRVRLADRALTRTNPLLEVAARVLALADARLTVAEVLDLAGAEPVSRRFGFDTDAIEQLGSWLTEAGIRWGLDASHRAPFALDQFPHGTWQVGLSRVALGAAMSDEDRLPLGLALPIEGVDSASVDLVGRFTEFIDRLGTTLDALRGVAPLATWLDALSTGVQALTDVSSRDEWQLSELHRQFGDIAQASGTAAGQLGVASAVEPATLSDHLLRLTDARALLADRLGGRPTRANFRTGHLTICTMVPMRSVPHRVICLLGLDDGVFPRSAQPDGDDVLARDSVVGERDRRGEDRQLFLDALMAATDHLVITYSGADERTGAKRPPAVPLGELIDAVGETCSDRNAAQKEVRIGHPLQPFDARNVTPGAIAAGRPFSYDPAVLRAARAAQAPRHEPGDFLSSALPPAPFSDVTIKQLADLLIDPPAGFLRQRLDVVMPYEREDPPDTIPVGAEALDLWKIGDRLLTDRLAGLTPERAGRAEWLRGAVPPRCLGNPVMEKAMERVDGLVEDSSDYRSAEARTVDVAIPFDGWYLTGSVSGVHGETLLTVQFGSVKPKHRLRAWIHLLALTVAVPETRWTAVTIGKDKVAKLGPVAADQAKLELAKLVAIYRRGLQEPLPVPCDTGYDYASARRTKSESAARDAAGNSWTSGFNALVPKDDRSAAVVRIWGADLPLEEFMRATPRTDEKWFDDQTRLGQYARRLWNPLLATERINNR